MTWCQRSQCCSHWRGTAVRTEAPLSGLCEQQPESPGRAVLSAESGFAPGVVDGDRPFRQIGTDFPPFLPPDLSALDALRDLEFESGVKHLMVGSAERDEVGERVGAAVPSVLDVVDSQPFVEAAFPVSESELAAVFVALESLVTTLMPCHPKTLQDVAAGGWR